MPERDLPDSSQPEHWPASTPRDEMLARVVKRGRRIRMINRIVVGLAITGAIGAGAVGVALGHSGNSPFSNTSPPSVPDSGGAPYYLCPGGGDLGQLTDGARVYLTGVDDSGDWVQVRAPGNLADRAWVERHHVDPDRQVDLPTASCGTEVGELERADAAPTTTMPESVDEPQQSEPEGDDEGEEPAVTTTSTTTSITPPTTTITPPTTSPPTTSSTTSTTSTTTTTTTTTSQPPTTQPAPVIGNISRNPAAIVERRPGVCGGAQTSSISVPIANATGATMSWNVGPAPQSSAMSAQGGVYSAVLGPFDEDVVASGHVNITVTVTASGPGGQRSAQTTVRLNDCYFG